MTPSNETIGRHIEGTRKQAENNSLLQDRYREEHRAFVKKLKQCSNRDYTPSILEELRKELPSETRKRNATKYLHFKVEERETNIPWCRELVLFELISIPVGKLEIEALKEYIEKWPRDDINNESMSMGSLQISNKQAMEYILEKNSENNTPYSGLVYCDGTQERVALVLIHSETDFSYYDGFGALAALKRVQDDEERNT